MHRNRTSQLSSITHGRETRQLAAILGILLTGIVAAIALPLWVAAILMLLALGALHAIASPEPVGEPVVIRRDVRR